MNKSGIQPRFLGEFLRIMWVIVIICYSHILIINDQPFSDAPPDLNPQDPVGLTASVLWRVGFVLPLQQNLLGRARPPGPCWQSPHSNEIQGTKHVTRKARDGTIFQHLSTSLHSYTISPQFPIRTTNPETPTKTTPYHMRIISLYIYIYICVCVFCWLVTKMP